MATLYTNVDLIYALDDSGGFRTSRISVNHVFKSSLSVERWPQWHFAGAAHVSMYGSLPLSRDNIIARYTYTYSTMHSIRECTHRFVLTDYLHSLSHTHAHVYIRKCIGLDACLLMIPALALVGSKLTRKPQWDYRKGFEIIVCEAGVEIREPPPPPRYIMCVASY